MVVSNILYFHPYLGKIPNLTSIFFTWVKTTNQWLFINLLAVLRDNFQNWVDWVEPNGANIDSCLPPRRVPEVMWVVGLWYSTLMPLMKKGMLATNLWRDLSLKSFSQEKELQSAFWWFSWCSLVKGMFKYLNCWFWCLWNTCGMVYVSESANFFLPGF